MNSLENCKKKTALSPVFDREEEHELLKELRTKTERMPESKMLITKEQASFLSILINLKQPTSVLEIGAYTGYSALSMALSFEGTVTTCDRNKEWIKIGEPYWKRAFGENQQRIQFKYGDALQTLSHLPSHTYDFIFVDADKKNYENYFNESLRLLNVDAGSTMIFDNFFLNGRLNDSADVSKEVLAMRSIYNRSKKQFRVCILEIADGMLLVQTK